MVVTVGCLIVVGIKAAINAKPKNNDDRATEMLMTANTILADVAASVICEGKNKHPKYKGLNHMATMNMLMSDAVEKASEISEKTLTGDSDVEGSEGD